MQGQWRPFTASGASCKKKHCLFSQEHRTLLEVYNKHDYRHRYRGESESLSQGRNVKDLRLSFKVSKTSFVLTRWVLEYTARNGGGDKHVVQLFVYYHVLLSYVSDTVKYVVCIQLSMYFFLHETIPAHKHNQPGVYSMHRTAHMQEVPLYSPSCSRSLHPFQLFLPVGC